MQSIEDAIHDYDTNSGVTSGEFKNEEDAKFAFTTAFAATECFNMYEEVDCWYFGGSIFGDKPTGRIDYVLTPKKILIDNGWVMGCVGVEVKKSGHKAGPLICQMIDYSKAVFRLPEKCGASLVCMTAICCFPPVNYKQAIGSVMANHRIGVARIGHHSTNLLVNDTNIFAFSTSGIQCKRITSGYKNGSR